MSTKLINNHVVFSFDHPFQIHAAAKVYRLLDQLDAMEKLTYTPKCGIGSYKGQLEPSIMMDYNDFHEYIFKQYFLNDQETYLRLCPRTPRGVAYEGYLMNLSLDLPFGEYQGRLGTWTEIQRQYLPDYEGWTRLDGKYFSCV